MQDIEEKEFRFDGWELRPRSAELVRDGKVTRLAQQPLKILVELVEHAGEVVTRDRLVQLLWPKGVVDYDNSLNAAVRKLRVALDDDSDTPRYIETLARIGYRFVAKLDTQPAPTVPAELHVLPSTTRDSTTPIRARKYLWFAAAAVALLLTGIITWNQSSRSRLSNQSPPAANSPLPSPRTTNQRAYELYLEARYHRSRRDIKGDTLAIERLQAALELDPYFAEAWATLGETYIGSGITQQSPVEVAFAKGRSAALRAVELNPRLAAGHSSLGTIALHYDFDYAAAEAEFSTALSLDDRYPRTWLGYGQLRGYQGRTREAFDYVGRARELEPTTLLYSHVYALLLYQTRRYTEAVEFIRPLLASQPRFDQARGTLIRSLVALGEIDEALKQLPLRYSDIPLLSDDALVYAHAGRRAEALRHLQRLEERRREGYAMSYEIAIVHAALGHLDDACAALRRAPEDHSPTLGWITLDPRIDPLRGQPCYAEVTQRLFGSPSMQTKNKVEERK